MEPIIKAHNNVHKTSAIAFCFVAILIVMCSLLIKFGLDMQNNLLQALGISYEQRILLERVNKQVKFLIETGQKEILTERVILTVRNDITTNVNKINYNQTILNQIFSDNFLSPKSARNQLYEIDLYMEKFLERASEIRYASSATLSAGYNFWRPVDTLIAHDGTLLKSITELNSYTNKTAITLNHWLYFLYSFLLLLVLIGLWLIWFLTLRPLANELKKYYEEIINQNKILTYNSKHDALTGLYNRMMFNHHLTDLEDKQLLYSRTCLMLIDVDQFKSVNDNFGHQQGDKALQRIAAVLKRFQRAEEYAYRLSGDEFAFVVDHVKSKTELLWRLTQLSNELAALSKPHHLVRITCSMGVAWGTKCGSTLQEIFNAADAALYHAKENGKNCYQLYDEISAIDIPMMLKLEAELHQAVRNREFIVYYQPIIQINSQEIVAFEALVRWQHPEKGLLTPIDWMETAERLSLMTEITCQVLEMVTRDATRWTLTQLPLCMVNINITETMLVHGIAFEKIRRYLATDHTLCIGIEVTESIFFHRSLDEAAKQLQIMHQAGINIALDDFGTGFANLSHLRHISFDTLKIDHTFTSTIIKDKDMRTIVKSLIDMSIGLNKKIIFEGVENVEILNLLLEMGCNYVQGHFYSKALPFEQLHTLSKKFANA